MGSAVGVLGSGPSNRRNTYALLKEHLASTPEATVVIPGSAPEFQDAERHAADYALENDIPFVILVDGHDLADLSDYPDVTTTEVEDARAALFEHVDQLLVAYDSNDTRLDTEIEAALRRGIKVYDLTDGLYPIILEGDQPEIPEPVDQPTPSQKVEPERGQVGDEAQANIVEPRGIGGELAVTSEFLDLVVEGLLASAFVDDVVEAVIAKIRERL